MSLRALFGLVILGGVLVATVLWGLREKEEPGFKALVKSPELSEDMDEVEKEREEPGFKELVKNPELWEGRDVVEEEREGAVREAKGWSEEKIAEEVRRFIFDGSQKRDKWKEMAVLRELEPRTHAAVVAILMEKELHGALMTPRVNDPLGEAPFERACKLFFEDAPAEAVAAVAPFLQNAKSRIRKSAALVLGKAATESAIPHLRAALAHEDESVRYSAVSGLQYAVGGKGVPKAVAESLFADLMKLVEDETSGEFAARLMVKFDAEKARAYFLSRGLSSANSKVVDKVLWVMADAKVAAPREDLLALIADLESKPLEFPKTSTLGSALHLLGRHGFKEDMAFIKARMMHGDEYVAEGAAAGMLALAGLEGFEERVWAAEEKRGYADLPDAQRYFVAVNLLDSEVNNGGFAQYFVNSSGDQWKNAVAGLEAIGSEERLAIAKEAVAVFGPAGPAVDRDERQGQLSKIYKKNEAVFETMESRYYESGEVLEVLMTEFVIRHAEQFR